MNLPKFCISWEKYHSNICRGLGTLQQNSDFVDMTIAADGYMVKVHKVIVGLASPFLYELIKSIPCPHPVVFVNSISYEVLCWILEYIYTGQVLVPYDKLDVFITGSKSLHVCGLENLNSDSYTQSNKNDSYANKDVLSSEDMRNVQNDDLLFTNSSEIYTQSNKNDSYANKDVLSVDMRNVQNDDMLFTNSSEFHMSMDLVPEVSEYINKVVETPSSTSISKDNLNCATVSINVDELINMPPSKVAVEMTEKTDQTVQTDNCELHNIVVSTEELVLKEKTKDINTQNTEMEEEVTGVQYTVSVRGCLQLILNRFIYNMHHKALAGSSRRWRCVDYRSIQCPAFVDSHNDVITNRKYVHNHDFHDAKILKKIEKNAIFTALQNALKHQSSSIKRKHK